MRILALAATLLALVACGRAPAPTALIVRPGDYPSPDGRCSLAVSVTPQGIVHWQVADAATGQPLASAGGFSTYHRWFFLWDEHSRLWAQNSDIGEFAMWADDGAGGLAKHSLEASSPLLAEMPAEVYGHLPNTLTRRLQIESGLPRSAGSDAETHRPPKIPGGA